MNDRNVNDTLLTNVDVLRPLGVNELDEHFFVERLTGNRMVLRGKVIRLHFRKF
ncbi:lipocalin-like domain-containing protein [Hallella sp.]|uniref:lipocalin-like domain-containing protein n=1 Tax=Hallella sp. TaxID=2980186 RepID=UPI0039C8BDB6